VNARDRVPAVLLVEVAGTGDAGGELAERGGLAAPEVADRVAVLAVPLGPLRREVAHLVAAGADVPRLARIYIWEVHKGWTKIYHYIEVP